MLYNWPKIVADKGFKTEKEMFETLRTKYKSLGKMIENEFKGIHFQTINQRLRKNGLVKKRELIEDYAKRKNISLKTLIKEALEECKTKTKTSKKLHINPETLEKYIEQFDLLTPAPVKSNNFVSGINDDIYMGWDPPCKDCEYRYKDKVFFLKCKECGKPQYWHDHMYPEALQHMVLKSNSC